MDASEEKQAHMQNSDVEKKLSDEFNSTALFEKVRKAQFDAEKAVMAAIQSMQ